MKETLDWLRAVWSRRRWLIVPTFLAPLSVGLTVALVMPGLYRATATVIVDRQQVPETLVAPTVTSALETRLQTISQEILSRSRLEALVAQFDLYPDVRMQLPSEAIVERMRRDITLELKGVDVRGQRQATVAFTVSYTGLVPEKVALVANTLASFYIEENLRVRERQAAGTAAFLRAQLAETKQRLDELERNVGAFKRRNLGELPEQLAANLATLERLQMQLRLNADGVMRAQERRTFLASQLEEIGAEGAVGDLQGVADQPLPAPSRLEQVRLRLAELRRRYTDLHPSVIAARAELEELTREIAARPADAASAKTASPPVRTAVEAGRPLSGSASTLRIRQALAEAETDVKVLKNENSQLRAAIASYQQRVERTPQREQEFKDLSRDYETTREFYQSLLKRHDEAQIAESMEQRQKGEQFRVIEPAVAPRQPIASRQRLIIMALVFSAGLAAGVAFLAEQFDTSFHTLAQLRGRTPLPVLVRIPRIITESDTHRSRIRARLATIATAIGAVVLASVSYVLVHGNEQLVWLVTRGRP
jgi:polysaccharide chain length determinant protein (PEP-CTERM system associated)